ncbi:hypothetical protein [Paraburkholderia graminis]|uniref:hypothetical protein n=1 Tax=Paraburkholderia graminis TaxID=60548 RepID=UPI0038B7E800
MTLERPLTRPSPAAQAVVFAGAMVFTVLYLRSFMRTEGHGALRDGAAPARHGLDGYESDGGGRASHILGSWLIRRHGR